MNDAFFSAAATGLPRTLRPDERMSLELSLLDRTPREHAAYLVVEIAEGCVSFRVLGKAVDAADDALVTYNPLALDLGRVPAGTTSQAKKMTFVAQDSTAPGSSRTVIGPFSASPDAFTVDEPILLTPNDAPCRLFELNLRFKAPATPGLVQGMLSWHFSAITARGDRFEGGAATAIMADSE